MKKIFIFFLIITICLLNSNFLTAQVNVNDSLALINLYNSTDGLHWKNNNNWLTTKPVSTWSGVSVFRNRVIQLFLPGNNLSGNIPSEFGNLDSLLYLTLDHNQLSGNIPSEIGKMVRVVNLNFQYNKLSGIPSSIGNLSGLRHLDLSHNQLEGSIPSELGNLTSNSSLSINLSYNNLSGSIPREFGNLSISLYYLHLDHNKLSGNIPSELGKLVHLGELWLQYNKLSGSIPPELGDLNLNELRLNNNKLTGVIPSLHTSLLHLSYNQLSGSIPSDLSKLTYLYDLRLDHNNLSGRVIKFNYNLRKGIVHLENNKFTFAGLLFIEQHFRNPVYSPQANIPIHKNGNILSGYAGGTYPLARNTYKWYKNGTLVSTITGDSTFTPASPGNYNVVVTNSVATQLTLYSDTINYVTADNLIGSTINNNNSSISLYPNPAKTSSTLLFNAKGKYAITIADVSGKILQTKTGISNKHQNIIQLDVSQYASGIYLVTITDEKNKKQTVKLNKE